MSEDDKTYMRPDSTPASAPASAVQITPGMVLKGTYRIDSELGSGGMGTVFRATHVGLEKLMAVKVLSPRAVSTPDSLARFEREAKVAGKVSHPAMTHVIDFGLEQGTPYIVMEYVAGIELAELIEREGRLPPRRAVAVMRQLVSLLRAAHALDIVHRDLKPANLKIIQSTPDDGQLFVKVLDFGVAKVVGDVSGQLTSEGMLVGTPAYMAPEQISGKPIDARTDLYSAGLIFHEMLSGKRAYKGETIARILHAQLSEPPPPLEVPVPEIIQETLAKFVAKRPEDRFQSAAEADQALQACEDALRPPSNVVLSSGVRPVSPEAEASDGVKTVAFRPATPVPPAPVSSESKPSSSVAVSPSLVSERSEKVPPPPVPALVDPPAPVPTPALVPPTARSASSGSGKVVMALLGVAFLFLLVGGAGAFWAWKSGLLGGRGPSTGPIAALPPADPRPAEPVAPPADPPPSEPEPTSPEPTEVAEAGTTPDTAAAGEPDEAPPAGDAAEAGAGAEAPAGEEAPPALEPGCYVVVVAMESSRTADGSFSPWMPESVDSRSPVNCASVPRGSLNDAQGLFKNWPDSPAEKVLFSKALSFIPKKRGAPDTRRMVLRVHTRVSEQTP